MAYNLRSAMLGILAFFSFNANSQNIKTYTGNYKGGTATYQYYENTDYERIFHGKFTYKTTNDNPAAYTYGRVYQDITINGTFKENKKDGAWDGKQVLSSQAANIKYDNANATIIVKGNYTNGLKTGLWTYKLISSLDKKVETVDVSFNFKNNILVGAINIHDLTGTLDNDGKFTGTWNLKSKGTEYIAEFQNNIFAKLIVRTISDGSVLLKYNNPNISNFLTDSIVTIDGTRYTLTSSLVLNKNGNDIDKEENKNESYNESEKNKYFSDFYSIISESIGSFDNTIEKISLGSTDFTIQPPLVPTVKKLTYKEKQQIEEEVRMKKLEAEKIEKERLEAIERKRKYDTAIEDGNKFFEQKEFKKALVEYNSANDIEVSYNLSNKIKATQSEIDRIEKLQNIRYDTYSYIKTKTETISTEMATLKVSLEDKKKIYGKNYEACMNILSANFASYFSRVTILFSTNKTNGLTIEDSWNDNDQNALDLLLKFKEELKPYEKFHNAVKTVFDTDNKEQLKLLKESDDPKEIISKF